MADARPKATRHPSPEQINWGALSDRSAQTLVEIAAQVAAGHDYAEIAARHGKSVAWCAVKMAELRKEIVEASQREAESEDGR
jgi:hypothetical protein